MVNKFKISCALLLAVISVAGYAQKLPSIQQVSVREPSDIKIDGKATEWNNKFQVYNHATDVFYTIANDYNNLYLVIQATIPNIIYKILNGGITFTINTNGKKSGSNSVSITYPLFERNNLPSVPLSNRPVVTKDSTIRSVQVDSFTNKLNEQLRSKSKELKVKGIHSIPDSVISIYNDYGIKTAESFDNKYAYTYELSIPLNSLGLIIDKEFMYNIKVNGMLSKVSSQRMTVTLIVGGNSNEGMSALYSTDFLGKLHPFLKTRL